MNTVIIYCHPDDLELKNRLFKTVVDELDAANQKHVVFRIFGDLYSPELLKKDEIDLPHNLNFDATISKIQKDIERCQHIVFVFPVYWDSLSHYVRRFTDEVFLSEWGGGKIFATEKKLKHIKATIITSMRIPQILFSGRSARGYSNPFTISILKLCGIKNIKWFNISKWSEQNPKIKDKKIEKMRERFNQMID